jgi:hypothetical protein
MKGGPRNGATRVKSTQPTATEEVCNNRGHWSEQTSWDEVCRRAAGRRHYNSVRRFRATYRRCELARLLLVKGGLTDRGTQARLARELGVSRSTICRDVARLLRECRPCPCCGALTVPQPRPADPFADQDDEPDGPSQGDILA